MEKGRKTNKILTILLIIGTVTVFFPLYMAVIIAFKNPNEMTNDVAGALSLPKSWSFSNFAEAMQVTDFWHSLGNSLLITLVTIVLAILIHSIAPVLYILTVFVLTAAIGRKGLRVPVYEIFTGGLMLGAFFMATDYASSPVTPKGQVIFAIGCGIITTLIRIFGGYPEGVSYSILIMNLAVPLIERFTEPKIFGALPKVKEAKKA